MTRASPRITLSPNAPPAISFTRSPDNGRSMAVCTCPECGTTETFACRINDAGQAEKRLSQMGWLVRGKTIKCPSCIEKGKAMTKPETITKETSTAPNNSAAPPEPTCAQKRDIIDMLTEVYDTSAERYKGGETDDTVATVLNVRPGWVQRLREELFGPVASNAAMDGLEERLIELGEQLADAELQNRASAATIQRLSTEITAAKGELHRIKTALGGRILQKAGIR